MAILILVLLLLLVGNTFMAIVFGGMIMFCGSEFMARLDSFSRSRILKNSLSGSVLGSSNVPSVLLSLTSSGCTFLSVWGHPDRRTCQLEAPCLGEHGFQRPG